MLTLLADQPESLWDDALPVEVKQLPEDLAALDVLLSDRELLLPIVERRRREFEQTGRLVLTEGRPTIAMETIMRLMVLTQRSAWGYRSLVAEVSDSIHLRRFCRISLSERVPDESTVRKVTRRIGPETVSELTRALIVKATREKRFWPRAVRIDSTVIEADVRYPTDSDLASHGVKVLAREGRKLAKLIGEKRPRVRDRSRSMGRKLRAISRTIRRRSGEAKAEVLKLTSETGELLQRSVNEARRLAAIARRKARGRGARQAFFTERLIGQRQASPQTVSAYRDTFRLLLGFAQLQTGRPPFRLELEDLDAPLIGRFLEHLESERGKRRADPQRPARCHALAAPLRRDTPPRARRADPTRARNPTQTLRPGARRVPDRRRD